MLIMIKKNWLNKLVEKYKTIRSYGMKRMRNLRSSPSIMTTNEGNLGKRKCGLALNKCIVCSNPAVISKYGIV